MPGLSLAHITAPLAANARAHPLDVLRVKSALAALGHYAAPGWGVTPYPDAALYAAIEAFQRARGLKPDGRMKPGGETEAALTEILSPALTQSALRAMAQAVRAMGRGGDTILAHITPGEARLLDAVTDGGSINPHTGLPEFKFGGGGSYRGHVRSDTLGRDGFDASADAKQQQAGASDFFRDGENARGAGDQGTQGRDTSGLDGAKTHADESRATASDDPAAQRTRHAYRAGFLGSVRQSFADGLLSGKETDQDYSRGPATRGHGRAADIRTQQEHGIGAGFTSGPTTRGGKRGTLVTAPQSAGANINALEPAWDAFRGEAGLFVLNGATGITALVGPAVGIGVNGAKYDQKKAALVAMVSPEQRSTLPARAGSLLGSGLTTFAGAAMLGAGTMAEAAGSGAAQAARSGVSPNAQAKAAAQGVIRAWGINLLGGRLAKGGTLLTRAVRNPSIANIDHLLSGRGVKMGEKLAGALLGGGLNYLTGKYDERKFGGSSNGKAQSQ